VRPEGLGKSEKLHLIGKRSRDLPACSIVPQPLRYRVPPRKLKVVLFLVSWSVVRLSPLGTSITNWLIVPPPGGS
jgi:hypothetical protein